jgi:hypothetical protein
MEGCWAQPAQLEDILKEMISQGRSQSLELALGRIALPEPSARDDLLTGLLVHALEKGCFHLAGSLLDQKLFAINRSRYAFLSWSLSCPADRLIDLIASHPGHAASLAPTPADFAMISSEAEGLHLAAFARHCCAGGKFWRMPDKAYLADLLDGLVRAGGCPDEAVASVAERLMMMGARPGQSHFEALEIARAEHGRCIAKTMRVLRNHAYYNSFAQS